MVNGIHDQNRRMLRTLGRALLVLWAVSLISCTTGKERAQEYYDTFSDIIIPYKDGTESILTEIQSMLQKQLKASGDFKLSQQDSVRQERLISEFETLSGKTVEKLTEMEELPEADLRAAGLRYVNQTSQAVLGAYREIARPLQDPGRSPDTHAIDSLSEMYSDQLVRSNGDFASRQLEFLKKFDLLSL